LGAWTRGPRCSELPRSGQSPRSVPPVDAPPRTVVPPASGLNAMLIRAITKADFDFVVSVIDKWWGGPSGERPHPMFFYELGDRALIAEADGAVVGFLFGFVAPTDPPLGYVHLVGIDPDSRRRGVGKRLYEHFIAHCRESGVRRIKAIT